MPTPVSSLRAGMFFLTFLSRTPQTRLCTQKDSGYVCLLQMLLRRHVLECRDPTGAYLRLTESYPFIHSFIHSLTHSLTHHQWCFLEHHSRNILCTGARAGKKLRETKCPPKSPTSERQVHIKPHKYVTIERRLEGEWRDGCFTFRQRLQRPHYDTWVKTRRK